MQLDTVRRSFEPLLRRLLHFYWRFARGLTIGVRALVIDGAGRVFLIKHSYIAGWHLPGGGVEVGETLMSGARARAARRGQYRDHRAVASDWCLLQSACLAARSHRALCRALFPPERAAAARSRNRGPRLLRARCASARHHACDARAHRRSARPHYGRRVLVKVATPTLPSGNLAASFGHFPRRPETIAPHADWLVWAI